MSGTRTAKDSCPTRLIYLMPFGSVLAPFYARVVIYCPSESGTIDSSPSTPFYIYCKQLAFSFPLFFPEFIHIHPQYFPYPPHDISLSCKPHECGCMKGKSYGWKHQTLLSQLIRPCEPRFPGLVLVSDWLLMSGRTRTPVSMNRMNSRTC